MKKPEIKTDRLLLRPLGSEYLLSVNEYSTDPDNARYMVFLPRENLEETAAFLKNVDAEWEKENPAFWEFAILHAGKHIGAVSVYFQGAAGELGWILNKKYWGNGFALEAAKAVIDFAVREKETTHFIAHCDTANTASCRVMEKLGMVRTGEYGGRRNRAAVQDSMEYQYEMTVHRDQSDRTADTDRKGGLS